MQTGLVGWETRPAVCRLGWWGGQRDQQYADWAGGVGDETSSMQTGLVGWETRPAVCRLG